MEIRNCTTQDLPAILEIFNYNIVNSTSLYVDEPFDMDWIEGWYEKKLANNYPLIGYYTPEGVLSGFATYGPFRERTGYRFTVEHSVYIHKDHQNKGAGKILLAKIIEMAKSQGFHLMIAVIDSENEISVKFHEKFGFETTGYLKEAGFKFNHWLNVVFMQLTLN